MAFRILKHINNNNLNQFCRTFKMSKPFNVEKVLDEMKIKNPYFDKYSAKIAALQQTAPEDFKQRLEVVDKNSKPKKIVVDDKPRDYSELLNPKKKLSATVTDANNVEEHKPLADIMKLELLENKSIDEIRHIWLEYHKNQDVIAAAIPVEKYNEQMQLTKQYPTFILPLPRSQGYEFFLLQFSGATAHFTTLLCYQVHKENAPECFHMIYYSEFREKGIILMRGEFDKNVINGQEAQCLANQMGLFYTINDSKKLNLLQNFNKHPDQFVHTDLIKQFESISL